MSARDTESIEKRGKRQRGACVPLARLNPWGHPLVLETGEIQSSRAHGPLPPTRRHTHRPFARTLPQWSPTILGPRIGQRSPYVLGRRPLPRESDSTNMSRRREVQPALIPSQDSSEEDTPTEESPSQLSAPETTPGNRFTILKEISTQMDLSLALDAQAQHLIWPGCPQKE